MVVGIFARVSGDVCELKGDAKIDGMPRGGGMGGAKDTGHQEPDGAGDAVAIAQEGGFIGDESGAGVIAQGACQCDGGCGVWILEREIQGGERMGRGAVFQGAGDGFDLRGIACFIGEVVEAAAEGVEAGGGGTAIGWEEFSREVETFPSAGEEFFGCAHGTGERFF
jgi:hypothetical protein